MITLNIPTDTAEIIVVTDRPTNVYFVDAGDDVIQAYAVFGSVEAFVREIERQDWHLTNTVELDVRVTEQVYKKVAR